MNETTPTYFPAFLDLQGRAVLVVGAGEVALRKIRLLLPTGAPSRVTQVSQACVSGSGNGLYKKGRGKTVAQQRDR